MGTKKYKEPAEKHPTCLFSTRAHGPATSVTTQSFEALLVKRDRAQDAQKNHRP